MTKRFANSTKVEHQKLFIYVDRMLEKEEIQLGVVTDPDDEDENETKPGKESGKSSKPKGQGQSSKAKPKAKAKALIVPPISDSDIDDEDWEVAHDAPATTSSETENVQALQQRMLYMENAMTELISHIHSRLP